MGAEGGFDPNEAPRIPEEDHIEDQPATPEAVLEEGKSAVYHGAQGNEIVSVKTIEGDKATIYPDVTDHSNMMIVSLDSLSPIQAIEIPEELRR